METKAQFIKRVASELYVKDPIAWPAIEAVDMAETLWNTLAREGYANG